MSLTPPSPDLIRTFRAAVGLSQVRLAEQLGVSSRAVEEWEAGRRRPSPYLGLALSALDHQLTPWRPDR